MIARMARLLRRVTDTGRPPPAAPAPARSGAYLGRHRFLTTTAHGQKIYLDTRDVTLAPHVILGGMWEPTVTDRVLACVRPGMRAVEVGCNQGWYTLLIAQQVGPEGRVIAFEANPDLVELVADSASINGYPWRVAVHNLAVSDAAGEATFYIRGRHLGNSSLGTVPQSVLDHLHDTVRETRVRTVALDQFLTGPDRRIDFLKIDAEGAEPAVFRGMEQLLRENDRVLIVMEYSPVQMSCAGHDPAATMAFLAGLGFGIYRIEDAGGQTRLSLDGLRAIEHCDLLLSRYDPPGP
jgi:FkbM family methyltransferase